MVMEEKIVINELEQGRELAKRLMSNLKHTSSTESSKILISEILRIYQNTIFMLGFKEDDKNFLEIEDKNSKKVFKKRKISEKKTETVRVFVGTGQDDGYCWRKYGQKEIHGSIHPRGYFRCIHRFTQKCLAVKQVQRSDKDPSIIEVKYIGDHTCNNDTSPKTTDTGRVCVTEQAEDIKPTKTEEVVLSLENKKNVFRTFSFSNHEIENVDEWKSNTFLENLSPVTTSGSGITSEIVTASRSVEYSETVDSCFSSLDNIIDFGQDWLWS